MRTGQLVEAVWWTLGTVQIGFPPSMRMHTLASATAAGFFDVVVALAVVVVLQAEKLSGQLPDDSAGLQNPALLLQGPAPKEQPSQSESPPVDGAAVDVCEVSSGHTVWHISLPHFISPMPHCSVDVSVYAEPAKEKKRKTRSKRECKKIKKPTTTTAVAMPTERQRPHKGKEGRGVWGREGRRERE